MALPVNAEQLDADRAGEDGPGGTPLQAARPIAVVEPSIKAIEPNFMKVSWSWG
jgi:hypothetical protein